MKLTIFSKVAIMLVLSIAAVVCPLVYTVMDTVDGMLGEEAKKTVQNQSRVVAAQLDGMRDNIESAIWQAVRRDDIINAVAEKNIPELERAVRDLVEHSRVEFVTVTDGGATVLLRTHTTRKGDSLSHLRSVADALGGKPFSVGTDSGNDVPLSVRGIAPIIQNGTVVGTMTLGGRLDTAEFVENLKKQLGSEVTVFKGEVRLSTTLKDASGKSMVGTSLDNPELGDKVLKKGETHMASGVMLGGSAYEVLYHPLRDARGVITGMYFIGMPSTTVTTVKQTILNRTAAIGGALAFVMALLGIFAARFVVTKPLARVAGVIRDLVDDKAELSYRFDTSSQDEVATLAHQVRATAPNFAPLVRAKKATFELEFFISALTWASTQVRGGSRKPLEPFFCACVQNRPRRHVRFDKVAKSGSKITKRNHNTLLQHTNLKIDFLRDDLDIIFFKIAPHLVR